MLGWTCRKLTYHVADGWQLRTRWIASPVRGLADHEIQGHTIARHVSVPPGDLVERLADQGLRAVSSFWDAAVARASINFAFAQEFETVKDWFFAGPERRLPLHVLTPSSSSIGYGVVVDDPRLRYTAEVTVIFERVGPTFYVLTAFPRVA